MIRSVALGMNSSTALASALSGGCSREVIRGEAYAPLGVSKRRYLNVARDTNRSVYDNYLCNNSHGYSLVYTDTYLR